MISTQTQFIQLVIEFSSKPWLVIDIYVSNSLHCGIIYGLDFELNFLDLPWCVLGDFNYIMDYPFNANISICYF